MTERITISLSDELADRIHDQLEYGDNRSELVRELLRDGLKYRQQSRDRRGVPSPQTTTNNAVHDLVPQTVDDEDARATIDATLSYLQEHEEATKADFVRDVMPRHDCGYDVPDDPSKTKGSWWRKVVRPALQNSDDVAPPKPGGSKYRWVG